jgi:Fe-S-cluster-containing hydrogenase component 2
MASKNKPAVVPKSGRIVHNPELCRGCKVCETACSAQHDGICSAHLSRIHIIPDDLLLEFPAYVCRQCDFPSCYYACPKKDQAMCIDQATGARFIHQEECLHCGSCERACPFTPSLVWVRTNTPKKTYFKCDLCFDRKEGPICVEVCPRGALTYEKGGGST